MKAGQNRTGGRTWTCQASSQDRTGCQGQTADRSFKVSTSNWPGHFFLSCSHPLSLGPISDISPYVV